MQQTKITIHNEVGLHARPAAQLVKLAKQFTCKITVTSNSKTVNAKSLILLLGLAVSKDAEIEITADGEDEVQAIEALVTLIDNNFAEIA